MRARLLVMDHRLVVARGLAGLGAEIFHRLVIEQTVDRLLIGVRVALVHLAADGDAPVGGEGRIGEIGGQRQNEHRAIAPVELVDEHAEHQRHFDDGRRARGHHQPRQRLDGVAAPLEDAGKPACLAADVKAQGQFVHVHEQVRGEPAHGVHRHGRKNAVPRLHKDNGNDPDSAHEQGETDGASAQNRQCRCSAFRERVCRPFESIGRHGVEKFADYQQTKDDSDAQFQITPAARPDIGPQPADRLEERSFGEGSGLRFGRVETARVALANSEHSESDVN